MNSLDLNKTDDVARQNAAVYEESRAFPRIKVNGVVAELVLADRKRLSVNVHDISPDGIQVRCDAAAISQLHAGGDANKAAIGDSLYVRFALPLSEGTADLLTECRIAYLADMPDGPVAFGLKYLNFVGTGECDLGRYLVQELEPKAEN